MELVITRRNGDVYTVLFDDEDADLVATHNWCISECGRSNVYVFTTFRSGGKLRMLYLHRLIMDASKADQIDHINHNGLDNRRSNLRLATPSQNLGNRSPQSGGTSRFKGVHWDGSRWRAGIDRGGRTVFLGRFDCEKDAADAYDAAAVEKWGEFALTNAMIAAGD